MTESELNLIDVMESDELTRQQLIDKVFDLNGELLDAKIKNQTQERELLSLNLKLHRQTTTERDLLCSIELYKDEITQLKEKLKEFPNTEQDSTSKETATTVIFYKKNTYCLRY